MTTCCEINLTDTTLECIVDKVNNQERLTREDGIALYETPDLWTVCSLADSVRRRLHGETTYFNINRHINYSNVCALSCKFCDFYRKKDQEGAYEHSIDDIRNEATIALFPANAAKTLANLRSKRYDSEFISLDDAEIRLRNLASIMGMIPWDGDQPDAA